jgi:hypothetical protein
MAAIVKRDDAAARARECRHPAGKNPVHLLAGREAVHEHDRLALTLIEKGNLDAVMCKSWHARP